MKILGLSFFYHDSAAVLLIDGLPVAMAEEERFSRKKHDSGFPSRAIKFVLKAGGVNAGDLDYVVFYEKPFLKFERIFKVNLSIFPLAPQVFAESTKHLFLDHLWVRVLISKKLGLDSKKVLFSDHHFSHAASAFFCSPFKKASILTIDGVGEWATTTVGRGDGLHIKILKEVRFPHSLGLLYSAFTAFLGFEVNEGEHKVMGMAPFGTPKYVDKVKKLINFFDDGSYELDLSYFSFYKSLRNSYSRKFTDLFGAPRDPKSMFFTGDVYSKLEEDQEGYADIAASLQTVLEEGVFRLANEAYKITGLDKLCFAGGVALNSVANSKMMKNTPFKELFIQPAAGDAGGALGAALGFYHQALGKPRSFVMKRADYGEEYDDETIGGFLKEEGVHADFISQSNILTKKIAQEIKSGKVIGWFQGRFEWGPRALGNRSILADPRRKDMKDIVNTKIKFREPYRPFAPSVLAEHAHDFFIMPPSNGGSPARFMLYVIPVKKNKQKLVPAITHVDGTARPQLVFQNQLPLYYDLIKQFYKLTGVPLVLNTSFNLSGEPIVNSPGDAYSTFMRSDLDILVLGNYLIYK